MAQLKVTEVAEALIASRGMVSHAAQRLGCSRQTIYTYIKNHPTVAEALEDARASLGDRIETTLLHEALGVQNPDGSFKREPNITALIFLAKTHPAMRDRGYSEHKKIEHSGSITWAQFIADHDANEE